MEHARHKSPSGTISLSFVSDQSRKCCANYVVMINTPNRLRGIPDRFRHELDGIKHPAMLLVAAITYMKKAFNKRCIAHLTIPLQSFPPA
jgi:hypothetical protein